MKINKTELKLDQIKQEKRLANKIITELNSVKNVEAEMKKNSDSTVALHAKKQKKF